MDEKTRLMHKRINDRDKPYIDPMDFCRLIQRLNVKFAEYSYFIEQSGLDAVRIWRDWKLVNSKIILRRKQRQLKNIIGVMIKDLEKIYKDL